MKLRSIFLALSTVALLGLMARAQSNCLDASEESHHRVVFENSRVRVLILDLPRIASTESYCYAHPYVYVVLGEGKSSTTAEGKGTFSHNWASSEARIVYNPEKQVVRNETGLPFRELIVELLHGAD